MSPAEALQEAARAGRLRQFDVSSHCLERMRQRNVTLRDISCALKSAKIAKHQESCKWRLEGGCDDDGERLDVVVVLTGSALIVTIF